MCKRFKCAEKTRPKTTTSWFSAYAFINDKIRTDFFLSKVNASNTLLSLIFGVTISLHETNWNVFDEWLWFRYKWIRNYFPHSTKILILLMKKSDHNNTCTKIRQKIYAIFMMTAQWNSLFIKKMVTFPSRIYSTCIPFDRNIWANEKHIN